MDSGNSGSLQSSSGGDEEYDSRAAAAADHSIYLNTHPPPQPPSMFDPFSNYTQQLHHQNPNNFSNNNPNPGWPGSTPIRSDPNPDPHQHSLANPFMSSFQPPPAAPAPGADTDNTTTNPGGSTAARNPRKRSRASRRAPTTVLTTDTTNFRAMVQEFTGIPAPPFSNPSFPRSNRLDNLFGSRSGSFDSTGSQLLRRPFSQRGQTPSFLGPSSTNNNNIISPVSNNYPFSHIQTSNNNLLNNLNNTQNQNQNQNPLFNNLFQTNPSKFIFSSSSVMASKPHNPGSFDISSNDMKIGPGLNEFGLGSSATTLNDLPSLISSDQARARNDREGERDSENAAKWRRNNNNNNNNNNNSNGTEAIENENGRDGYNNEGQMKPVYEYSGSTSSFLQGEKGPGPENVATTRAGDQGMVESWIYSSE
ncbi:hypothetical protein CASFOL_034280 [Castilleja foliolosa]|uniref:VQ domain-containing protein n=1 Tax=Castilleja foliolosa TaxID=1961234 RepID=A0ABD3BXY1_9LAMI